MSPTRSLLSAAVAVVCAAFVAASATGADRTTHLATLVQPACSTETRARTTDRIATPMGAARISALHVYDDAILDVATAPDICQQNAVTNDNVVMTFAVHIHDRAGFAGTDTYELVLDTDGNPATGAPAETGATAGAEYVIALAEEASTLTAWDGTAFTAVDPQPVIPTLWAEGFGPILQVEKSVLGNPQTLNLIVRTGNATDVDLAPDSGSWSYSVTPLRLKVSEFTATGARAGRPFAVVMQVVRSDFDIGLDEGSVACTATIAGKKLAKRGRFLADFASCLWRIPKTARGKRVRGTIAVTFQGVTVKRAFSALVK